ncbi:MAG TPA: hypothetical protein VIL74_07825 [Pyrinomonadaceae bacterium]|jgi:hypothetical protein
MFKQRFVFAAFCLAMIVLCGALDSRAQQEETAKTISPDLSVVGVRLGDRAGAQAFLKGFQPRIGANGRPEYCFYNKAATQVLKLTGASFDDPFFITEIEVYKVGRDYRNGHFQADKISYFKTEKEIFVGYRQSTASAITGIPNVDGKDNTGPKAVVKKIGEPTSRTSAGENEVLNYELPEIVLPVENGATAKFGYAAQYEFKDGKLKKFVLKIAPRL